MCKCRPKVKNLVPNPCGDTIESHIDGKTSTYNTEVKAVPFKSGNPK